MIDRFSLVADLFTRPCLDPGRDTQSAQESGELFFKRALADGPLGAFHRHAALGAVVVGVGGAVFVGLGFSRDHHPAGSAPNQPGERKAVFFGPSLPGAAKQALHSFKLTECHHWLLLARIDLPVPQNASAIEGIAQHLVDSGQCQRFAAAPLDARGAEAPFITCHDGNDARRIGAGQKQLKHLPDKREVVGIGNDGARYGAIAITKRCATRAPALVDFGLVAALYVLGQRIAVIFGLAEHDGKHELALRIVLEGVGGEF